MYNSCDMCHLLRLTEAADGQLARHMLHGFLAAIAFHRPARCQGRRTGSGDHFAKLSAIYDSFSGVGF
jgi:hypothetical protein